MIDINKANQLVNWLCQEHKITIRNRRDECSGMTYFSFKKDNTILKIEVDIPIIKNSISLGVALHEIGHAVNKIHKPAVLDEFLAEMFAVNTGKEYGFNMNYYLRDVKRHVLITILNSFNKNLKYENIPEQVLSFIEPVVPDLKQYEGKMSFCIISDDDKKFIIKSYPKIKKIVGLINKKTSVEQISSGKIRIKSKVLSDYESIIIEASKYDSSILNNRSIKEYKI